MLRGRRVGIRHGIMDIRIVTLRYSESLGGFPEEPLRQVLTTGNVVEQREYFFTHGGVPHLTLVLVMDNIQNGRGSDSKYACRCGKGSHRAVLRARTFCRRYRYYLKTDIRRYYDSVDHGMLEDLLGRLLRERSLLRLLSTIIRHPLPGQRPGYGLPIGNLTSQWFGNLYLDATDHWIKETRRAPGYVRYMDDLVMWSDSKAWLWALADDLAERLCTTRSLELKLERTVVGPCGVGVPFLGYRIFPALIRQQGMRVRRRRRLFRQREAAYLRGELSAKELTACARSINGSREFLHAGEPLRSEIEL